ncbi:hypothetical protein IJ098_00280 [Candidatus Saccharibacteria bacterium]|nr:hypothetical protein [Candidatus Saccharibacteria bacterium]
MREIYSNSHIKGVENPDFAPRFGMPSFKKAEAYAFDSPDLELYHELSRISEEVERCRQSHLR